MEDTIFALASARGKAGIAVIRVSGPLAFAAGEALCGTLPALRQAGVRRLQRDGAVLDEALVLCFGAGASFTGEPVVEFQVHGGIAVVDSVLSALEAQPGLRVAEPGEFTQRAFRSGRIDLAQVEGLADLIDAETEAQRRLALHVLAGAVGQRAALWREDLLRASALVEASIDFADEDVPVDVWPEVLHRIEALIRALQAEAAGSVVAERMREGFEVAIVGPPNAGKSTLLNRLAGRDVAIASPLPGTTRDVLEVRLELDGLPVTVMDTAGMREAADVIEEMGVARAKVRAEAADLRVFLHLGEGPTGEVVRRPDDIVLRGRGDEVTGVPDAVSGLTGAGVDVLVSRIGAAFRDRVRGIGALTQARHRRVVAEAVRALESARDGVRSDRRQAELVAEALRQAREHLGALIGVADTEAVLGEIFARFCIGK
jgi:tRNA modification GTPase